MVFYFKYCSHLGFSRDVLKWLFSAIKKSTEQGETTEAAKERDEQIRLIAF